ncbi:MAG: phage terminase large subunit [Acidobacteriales bacterium]|nr:phage terminase large subunit [Terriglobales bacterium]
MFSQRNNRQDRDLFELQERVIKLLPSQRTAAFAPEPFMAVEGGWGSGKTFVGCLRGLVLSKQIPGNVGLVARYHGTDLEDSTMPVFFEVCPPSWIRHYSKQRKILTLKNGSQVVFRHIHDSRAKGATKSRRVGLSLGWFYVDQAEELEISHWNMLIGRLRLPRAQKRFGFLTANPNGKDWIYKMFFEPHQPFTTSEFYQTYRRGSSMLGIAVRSEENRKSNGGFVDDEYFDSLRQQMPPEWVARYVDCSFDEFTGKIYKEYTSESVHNIEPFDVPAEYPYLVSIDVGGDVPWAVGIWRVDPWGNLILTDEFYKPSVNALEVAAWIKQNARTTDPHTQIVIDYENKLAMLELNEYLRPGVQCRPAIKAVRPGIIRTGGYLHVNNTLPLPPWYVKSQPESRTKHFTSAGSPRMFVMRSRCPNWSREMDYYRWDENSPGKPLKDNDHHPDETRYAAMSRPQPARLPQPPDEREKLRKADPLSARAWDNYDKIIAARRAAQTPAAALREVGIEEISTEADLMMSPKQQYDWGL